MSMSLWGLSHNIPDANLTVSKNGFSVYILHGGCIWRVQVNGRV